MKHNSSTTYKINLKGWIEVVVVVVVIRGNVIEVVWFVGDGII